MRVKKISAFVLAMVLCLSPFTLFSFAADTQSIKDSGSPEVSLLALRSIAADDGISLAAAEGDSGQFGYNIEPYLSDLDISFSGLGSSGRFYNFYYTLPQGQYVIDATFSDPFSSFGAYMYPNDSVSIIESRFLSDNSVSAVINVPNTGRVGSSFGAPSGSTLPSNSFVVSFNVSSLIPVEGISSGFTYNSGILDRARRSIFDTINPSFGNQPAGKYLINIYHWGDSYDVRFQISDSTESYYLSTSTNGSVTTLVYNHPGGDFTLNGSFTADNIETTAADGYYATSGNSTVGDVDWHGPSSWVFNITDIVAIPYEQASDSNFGFFASIIGFFRDQFSDMKSWIATQIDKIAGDDETKTDVDDAQSELQKEVEDLNNLSGQLDTQASNLEQQFTTDFAIPDTVSGQGANFQSIYTSLFGSLGVFGIFIWLPIVMAVIKKLLRL